MSTLATLRTALETANKERSEARKERFCRDVLPTLLKTLAPEIPAPFDGRMMTLVNLEGSQYPYQELKRVVNGQRIHWGQLKLYLSEIEFLFTAARVHGLDIFTDKLDCIVYAGAADGRHFPALFGIIPPVEWHLYDPAKFDSRLVQFARGNEKIKIFNEYFTDEIAEKYVNKRILFISDVRRVEEEDEAKSAILKLEDHELQARWVRIMKPIASMLKFSPPYEHQMMKYFKGLVLTQAFAPGNSTECRLIFSGVPEEVLYDTGKFESVMCYHNRVRRETPINELVYNVGGHDWKIRPGAVSSPPFIGHDVWRMNQILLMAVLTREASMKYTNAGLCYDYSNNVISADNWDHIPQNLIFEIISLRPAHIERLMDDVIRRFLNHLMPFPTYIIRHILKTSDWTEE